MYTWQTSGNLGDLSLSQREVVRRDSEVNVLLKYEDVWSSKLLLREDRGSTLFKNVCNILLNCETLEHWDSDPENLEFSLKPQEKSSNFLGVSSETCYFILQVFILYGIFF